MSIIDLEATAKRAVELMTEKGVSWDSIRTYSNFGFTVIIKHFARMGIISVTPEMLDKYIVEQKDAVKNGSMSYKMWKRLHRGAEFLKLCAEKDSIDIPNGTRWDYIKDYTRYNIWEHQPSESQLSDPDNIYALVWKTGKALENSEITADMVSRYKSPGLRMILQIHIDSGTDVYSEELVKSKVSEIYNSYKNGEVNYGIIQPLRKAANFVKEMHDNGKISMTMLSRWGLREPIEPFKSLLDEYVKEEKENGTLVESSIDEMRYRIRAFLFTLEDSGYDSMECFRREVINHTVADLVKCGSGDFSNVVKPIKKFLAFLYEKHYTSIDLRQSLPEFAAKKHPFHEGFSKEEVDKLLAQPDRTTAIGKRDYAIMMVVAQTGLRGCDVVRLKFENIDWRTREIRLIQRKTGKPIILPLEPESGNAVADYILHGRPKSDLPYLFLSHKGMRSSLKCNNGVLIVSHYMKKAGIESNHRSVHALRRTYGTRLLQSEVPIEMIRQLLGHSNMDSSKPYLSIDEQGLKKCALPLLSKYERGGKK